MSESSDKPGTLREYRVVCKGEHNAAYIVQRSAMDPLQAMESAEKAGHAAALCMPFGLTRAVENQIIRQWLAGDGTCPMCGYSFAGLPASRHVICPECGLGDADTLKRPYCAACGYCLAGISTGSGPLRCPECGSTSPFVKRK